MDFSEENPPDTMSFYEKVCFNLMYKINYSVFKRKTKAV